MLHYQRGKITSAELAVISSLKLGFVIICKSNAPQNSLMEVNFRKIETDKEIFCKEFLHAKRSKNKINKRIDGIGLLRF